MQVLCVVLNIKYSIVDTTGKYIQKKTRPNHHAHAIITRGEDSYQTVRRAKQGTHVVQKETVNRGKGYSHDERTRKPDNSKD